MSDFYVVLFLFGIFSYILPLVLAIAIVIGYLLDKRDDTYD